MKVMAFCRKEVTRLEGNLEGSAVQKFLASMIDVGEKKSAVDCVVYAAEQRLPESLKMGQTLTKSFDLDDVEKNQLNLLFSHDTQWTKLSWTF